MHTWIIGHPPADNRFLRRHDVGVFFLFLLLLWKSIYLALVWLVAYCLRGNSFFWFIISFFSETFFTMSSFDICGISLNMILITLWGGGGFASLHEEYPPVITTTTNATCMSISLLQLAHGAITSVYLLLQDHSNKLWINYLWWLPIR